MIHALWWLWWEIRISFYSCIKSLIFHKDWANPAVCDHIRLYPVIPQDGVISEVYHAQKWRKDTDRRILSPMYDDGNRHFYIDELARLKNGHFVIPLRWLEDHNGNVLADAYAVTVNDEVWGFHLKLRLNPTKSSRTHSLWPISMKTTWFWWSHRICRIIFWTWWTLV